MGHVTDDQFAEPHTAVFTCRHVNSGSASVLLVVHDEEGDWQFLCGGKHDTKDLLLVGVGHLLESDPSLRQLSSLCSNHRAERTASRAPWRVTDDTEGFIRACLVDPGWSVQLIPGDEAEESPGFAYTIGLFHNYGHAELIVLGLSNEVMHFMLNDIAKRIQGGEKFKAGARLSDVLEGYDVMLKDVLKARSFEEHVGYALWFYQGKAFPLQQVLWPDKAGRFPGDAGTAEALARRQPVLS